MTLSVWDIYKKAGVHRLPVDPVAIADALGIKVVDYKTAVRFFDVDIRELYLQCPLGFSFKYSGVLGIALNENACGDRRRRFTAAHELAHCVLGHLDSKCVFSQSEEQDADRFAAELLAPLIVLSSCGARSAEKISRLCGISREAALIRLKQLAKRERRGFYANGEELRVAELFREFIINAAGARKVSIGQVR